MEWQPIETAPVGKTMILVIGITRDDGKPYVSDPYCVWQPSPGKFTRWPHDFFEPTHWMPLPEPPK